VYTVLYVLKCCNSSDQNSSSSNFTYVKRKKITIFKKVLFYLLIIKREKSQDISVDFAFEFLCYTILYKGALQEADPEVTVLYKLKKRGVCVCVCGS
jgi:hypothetical protein